MFTTRQPHFITRVLGRPDWPCLREPPRKRSRSARLRTPVCLWGPLQPIIDLGSGAAVLGAIAWSSLPLLTGQAAEQNRKRGSRAAAADEEEGDGVKFGVMTVVGAIPLVNWSAWIFAALEDEELRQMYYLFAALYGLPMLSRGFSQDAFSIATIILGVVHIQVERISRTEAVKLNVPSSISRLAGDLQRQAGSAFAGSQASNSIRQIEDQPPPAELEPDEHAELADDLSQWDRRFQQNPRQKSSQDRQS